MRQQLTAEETNLLLAFIREYTLFVEEMIGPVYGPYMGGDPRNFTPDPKASTAKQRERHRKACVAWGRGERRFATGFGYGATHDKANDERCKRLRHLLGEFDRTA